MDDLRRATFLREGASKAGCDDAGCLWSVTKPAAAVTAAARARAHTRETGHVTRVTDVRVTVYKPAEA